MRLVFAGILVFSLCQQAALANESNTKQRLHIEHQETPSEIEKKEVNQLNKLVSVIDSRDLQNEVEIIAKNEAAKSYLVRFSVCPLGCRDTSHGICAAGDYSYIAYLKLNSQGIVSAHKEVMTSSCEDTGETLLKKVGLTKYYVGTTSSYEHPVEKYVFIYGADGKIEEINNDK